MDKTSLGFQKPKEEEYYDINIFNQNAQLANDLIEKNSSAIGQLSNTRGYSNIPIITTDILLKNTNGWCRGINIPNAPIQNTWVFYRTVIMGDSFPWGYGFVRAYDYENKREFVNFRGTSGWEGWREIATSEIYTLIPLVGVSAAFDETPTLIKTGKICAIYGTVNLNSITPTSSIFQRIPPQFVPKRGAEIFMKNLFPPTLLPETRLFVNVDGIISIHGFTGTLTSTSASFNGIWEVQ